MNVLDHIQLLIDFGLVILIWMVQIIIYPSFLFYKSDSLSNWHPIYTGKITIIVAPLMIAQIILASYLLVDTSTYNATEITALVLIAINWLLTMLVFIPLHQKIDQLPDHQDTQIKLVQYNWIRVLLFCAVFFIHVYTWYAMDM